MTRLVRAVDPDRPDPATIAAAAAVLRAGGLVAFPTETVYGLGADALDDAAVRRIFAAKGRPSFNPVIAHVADAAGARALVTAWPDAAARLAAAFWPGPLTLVLPKRPHVPDALTAGLPAVAVRVPAHAVARALVAAAGVPVAAPSANRYTEVSPTTAAHVVRGLGDRVDLVLDGGPTAVGIESTVVDLTGVARGDGPPRLLRPGPLAPARIAAALGAAWVGGSPPVADSFGEESFGGAGASLAGPPDPADGAPDAPRLAPGMVARHYAPRAAVWPFDPDERPAVAARLARWRAEHPGARAAAVLLAAWDDALGAAPDAPDVLPADPDGYARRLYAALHAADAGGAAVVLVERPPDAPGWEGVRDRVARAAA